MSSLFSFGEDNGAQAGNPLKGATRNFAVPNVNWKNSDDWTGANYSSFPVTAGANSYWKHQFPVFTGTFNTVSNVKFGHTTGFLGAGMTLVCKIGTGYATPATTALSAGINITIPSGLATYQTVTLGTAGPEQAGASSISATGYGCYCITQIQTTTGAAAGDNAESIVLSLSYDES